MLTNKNSSKTNQRKRTKKDIWIGMGKADASFLFSLWPITTAQDSRKFEWSSRISRGSVGKLGTRWKRRYNTLLTHASSWSERSIWKYTRQIRHLWNNTSRLPSNRGYVMYIDPCPRSKDITKTNYSMHFFAFITRENDSLKGYYDFVEFFFSSIKITRLLCLHISEYLFVDCNRVKLVCLVYIVYSLRGIRLLCQFKWFSD